MKSDDRIEGLRVLIVDDEPDVLDSLEELLSKCRLEKASTYEQAKDFLETKEFDLAIFDIMGVNGYKLLDIANEKKITSIMLTAHALSPEETVKSHDRGAAFFVPKEKMSKIAVFINDVLEAKEGSGHYWATWLERFGNYYEEVFGPDWKESHKEFWDELTRQNWRLASVLRREEERE